MHDYSDSRNRRPGDYLLFAIAFLGFWIAGSGVIVSSAAIALTGATMLLVALMCFLLQGPR